MEHFMAVCIDKQVLEQVHKFAPVDRNDVKPLRNPALPDDYFKPHIQQTKLDPDTKSLNLHSMCFETNGKSWFRPSPITMFAYRPHGLRQVSVGLTVGSMAVRPTLARLAHRSLDMRPPDRPLLRQTSPTLC